MPGPPAWWLGSGRESPATGIAGREAKHTSVYRQFTQRAEMLLATIDESVLNSTVASHIQGCATSAAGPRHSLNTHVERGSTEVIQPMSVILFVDDCKLRYARSTCRRTQMIDVATFWDAWEGEIPPEGAMPEWSVRLKPSTQRTPGTPPQPARDPTLVVANFAAFGVAGWVGSAAQQIFAAGMIPYFCAVPCRAVHCLAVRSPGLSCRALSCLVVEPGGRTRGRSSTSGGCTRTRCR